MSLSDAVIRNAKAQAKQYKLHDAGGLFMIVKPSGGKLWRLKYRFNGTEQQLSLGIYPAIGLKDARERRDAAKKLLANNIDPNAERKRKEVAAILAAENTFKSLMDEFIDLKERDGLAGATLSKQKWFASQLAPALGDRPIAEIEALEVLNAVKDIEKRGNYETAKRVRAFASRVFRYAIITGRAKVNPASELGEALIVGKVRHHAAIVEPKAVGALMRAIDTYDGNILTCLSLKLIAHIFVRPGELRHAEWSEIDFDAAVWRIPAGKMKMRQDHVVPLSRQALALLTEAKKVATGGKYVFPSFVTNL
ncbi:MAG: tyrosine-type recombinase/integrase, partial [Asticcacaulis sp.]